MVNLLISPLLISNLVLYPIYDVKDVIKAGQFKQQLGLAL